jgi:GPH family glycoside/pentoside/hexuronide:cation symporter
MTKWQKLAYGIGDSGFSLTSTALALLYLDFLVNVVGLAPGLAGIAIGAGRIWDAANDLFIGALSDRTRSRWGRRRPYLLFGAVPFGLAFVFMWLAPPGGSASQPVMALYYAGTYVLFDTLFTLVNVPYIALTPELAPTYDERTSLHSYRMAFSIGFGLIGAIAPLALVDLLSGGSASPDARRAAYGGMAVILALVSVAPIYVTALTARERPEFQTLPTPSPRESFRLVTGNRAFLIAAGIYLLTWIPIDLIQYVLVFLMRDYFGLSGGERDLAFLLLFGVAVLALPLWVWVARRWDKRRAYQIGIALLSAMLIALSLAQPGQTVLVLLIAAVAGVGLSAAHAIPLAILPDVIDWDELRSATRQEGAYYSVITLTQKVIGAATIALTGALLAATGYVAQGTGASAGAEQPPAAIDVIRFLTGPLPALFFLLGIGLVSVYPITRERHARILRALERRRQHRCQTS